MYANIAIGPVGPSFVMSEPIREIKTEKLEFAEVVDPESIQRQNFVSSVI